MTAPGSTAVSFDAFYRAQHARVLGYFRRKAGRDAAPDLAQEVFARLLRSGALERAECPEAYLIRIARNLLIDIKRSKRSAPTAFYSLDEERDAVSCADQTWRAFRKALLAMPPRTRRIFLMHRLRGLTYAQIAEQLGLGSKAVEKHIGRALKRCRKVAARFA